MAKFDVNPSYALIVAAHPTALSHVDITARPCSLNEAWQPCTLPVNMQRRICSASVAVCNEESRCNASVAACFRACPRTSWSHTSPHSARIACAAPLNDPG